MARKAASSTATTGTVITTATIGPAVPGSAMSRASRGIACATALCLAGAQSDPASAAEWGVSVGSGILYTDNLERTPDGKEVTLATTDVAGQLLSVGDQYDVDVEASVIWREYLDRKSTRLNSSHQIISY